MSDIFGFTRTIVKSRYALITPDGFVPSVVPGWKNAVVVVNISPAMAGPRFTQLHVTLAGDGSGGGNTRANQDFIYVIEGAAPMTLPGKQHPLQAGRQRYFSPSADKPRHSAPADTKIV